MRYLDKYIMYYADKWETNQRLKFALAGLGLYSLQILYMWWAILMIPVTVYLLTTLYYQNKYIDFQTIRIEKQYEELKEQNVRVVELHNAQLQALNFEEAVKMYYNELIKSRGLEDKGFIIKKVGSNAFELQPSNPGKKE